MPPSPEPLKTPQVQGYLHRPVGEPVAAIVLTHGAGSHCEAPLLRALGRELAGAGLLVLRMDLPYRRRRPMGPPRPPEAAGDRQGLRDAIDAVRKLTSAKLCLGGHSYGGRQASMLAAEDPTLAAALLLLSYPLHPPRKPEQLRTAHFPHLRTPVCFVHGTRDPFGSIGEMEQAVSQLAAPHRIIAIDGAGHDLRAGRDLSFCPAFLTFGGVVAG
ncbi:MAG: alpha/beta fold hydrolase [Acidimicrobiia bacterium]|nr:alpha/beta fold hydrolase [Acidimicrobiia bacterium]